MTVEVLLDRNATLDDLTRAASELYDALTREVWAPHDGTPLSSGLAISPADAANCTKDPIRTAVLLRAVDAALRDALERFGPIDVVYAGTGPLAPLVTPLLPRFANAPVRFTFIDVHAKAVEATRKLAAGAAAAIDFVVADATTYEHPRPLHVVITETMQRALTREPHVEIVRNLVRQLVPGGILVPESVRIDLAIGDHSFPLLDLRIETAATLPDTCVTIEMPPCSSMPAYQTTITAYREHIINPFQSGLTHPELAPELAALPAGTTVTFRYRLGPAPGLVHAVK